MPGEYNLAKYNKSNKIYKKRLLYSNKEHFFKDEYR